MRLAQARVFIHGRLRGLTQRRIEKFITAAGAKLARRGPAANIVVVTHSSVGTSVADDGTLTLGFAPRRMASLISEDTFRRALGLPVPAAPAADTCEGAELERLSGLHGTQIRALSVYDVLEPAEGRFSYEDIVAARSVGRLLSAGAPLARIIAAALALRQHRCRLAGAKLARAPWGEIVQEIEGRLAGLDGQLLLPLGGDDIDADEAFRRAEASEAEGDLAAAERWYALAAELDREDPVIRFNLANVLDGQGRTREAELAYRQALERNPQFADAWFNLGILQERTGRNEEALASYRAASRVEPGYLDALHNAAALLMRLGRFAEALRLWERIVDLAGKGAGEARRLAHLCRLEIRQAATRV